MDMYINILGWLGSLLLVLAYYQNSRNILSSQSLTYQLLNIGGSTSLIANTLFYGAYPSSAVNVLWVIIGIRYLNVKNKKQRNVH